MNTFGYLTQCGDSFIKGKDRYVPCVCVCGVHKDVRVDHLLSGGTKSCGCMKRKSIGSANTKHGMSKSSEYRSWRSMLNRCYNTNHDGYCRYGEQGVTVCERWLQFANFIEDMGAKPDPSHTIERIDNNKGYSPDNCVWGTKLEQTRNRKNTIRFTFEGTTLTLAEWSKRLNIAYASLWKKYNNRTLNRYLITINFK